MATRADSFDTDGEHEHDGYLEEESSWLPRTPSGTRLNLGNYIDKAFSPSAREDAFLSGLTLLDTVETFFDARLDLWERQLKKQRDKIQTKATLLAKERKEKFKTSAEEYDKEMQKFKLKVSARLTHVTEAWQSSRVVRTREKVVFFAAVMNVFISSLLIGLAPEWIHILYTFQAIYLLPLRFFQYNRKGWGYFLADLCYFANAFTLVWIWIFPWSDELFMACYCLAHGSLATAVITWRNSLVFHDHDKMVSLFIHIYPPLSLTIIRHFYPNAGDRFPAMKELPTLNPFKALMWSALLYLVWQGLYWRMLLVRRADKIKSGQRITSFQYMLKDKHGPIGKMIRAVNPDRAELYFMMSQFAYSIVTELPAVFVLYNSKNWSVAFLAVIFAASAWNGGGYYIEVFGRKFERELEALRKELATAQSQSSTSSPFGSSPNSPRIHPITPGAVIPDADKLDADDLRKRAAPGTIPEDLMSLQSRDSASSTSSSYTGINSGNGNGNENESGNGLQLYEDTKKTQ